MSNTETTYRKAAENLAKMQGRRDSLWKNSESAKSDLVAYRQDSAKKLIAGADGERIAGELSKHEAKAGMFSGALAEIDKQIAQAQTVSDEAKQKWSAEQDTETIRKVREATVKLIKQMGNLQVDLAKVAKLQQTTSRVIVDFNAAATELEKARSELERDSKISERSKTPNAARRAGWLDDKRTIATLGSAVRDWAREQAR